MRSEKFHRKGEKPSAIVVDEASRLTINAADESVHIYQLDDNGKKVKLLGNVQPGSNAKFKLHDVEEIWLESKGDFNSVIEGQDPLDTTPIEVPVEAPLTQTQQLRMWLQNEENMRNYAKQELSWEDFKDLGDLDDGSDFYKQFNEGMTKYEMQAEALRQESNPLRGNPITDYVEEKQNAQSDTTPGTKGDTDAISTQSSGQMDNTSKQEST
jgi:hypothetical protein